MQQSMVTMHQEHWFILQFFYLFAMVSGAYLFWCALAVLRNNPLGSSKLRQAFIVAIAYLTLSVLLGLYMYFETKPIMDRYLEDVVSTVPPAASAIMRTSVKIGTNVALVAQIAFLVIKIVLYLLGIVYLGKVAKQMQTQDSANPATAPAA